LHSQEELGSPALAFVRAACHVLALDTSCSDAVAVLRRQLLRLLHVREFSAQADFQEMCLALTLPDVICTWVLVCCLLPAPVYATYCMSLEWIEEAADVVVVVVICTYENVSIYVFAMSHDTKEVQYIQLSENPWNFWSASIASTRH
jgi:hypothetical protein